LNLFSIILFQSKNELKREYWQYGEPEFERLASISMAHLVASVTNGLDHAAGPIAADQTRHLRPGSNRSSSPGTGATSGAPCGFVSDIAVGADPASTQP
jgi:hypothetical protein